MNPNFNFGRVPQPKVDLGEWMMNQQRQFQEFERSFGMPSAFGSSFRDPFGDSFFSSPFQRRDPFSLQHSQFPPSFSSLQSHSEPQRLTFSKRNNDYFDQARDEDHSPRSKVMSGDKFEIEVNVEDYRPEELFVKTEGDVLTIHARQENRGSCKEFQQRFSIPPGVRVDKLSSSLSKNGVLVISAPRETLSITNCEDNDVVDVSNNCRSAMVQPNIVHEDDKLTIEVDVRDYSPDDLDVRIDGDQLCVTANQEVGGNRQSRSRVFEQKFTLPPGVRPEDVQSSLTKDGTLVITAAVASDNTDKNRVTVNNIKEEGYKEQQPTQSLEEKFDQALSPRKWSEQNVCNSVSPLDRRQNRNLPLNPYYFDNGISKVDIDDKNYNIHVNVQSFNPEDLVIKTVDDCVVVEANHEEKTGDGRSYSNKQFSQSFNLPEGINPESVTSSLSKDGVLTISAPLTNCRNY